MLLFFKFDRCLNNSPLNSLLTMNDYVKNYTRARRAIDNGLQRYIVKVYVHMTLGLLITALGAAAAFTFTPLTNLLFTFNPLGQVVGHSLVGYVVMFAPFAIAMYTSRTFIRSTFAHSRFLLSLYAALIGMSFASLAFFYTIDSLHKTFLITACTFATMSIYGYTTNRDLTSLASFCMMAIWGIVISSLINIFLHSSMIDFVASFVGVIVFTGFTACETQKLKNIYYELQDTALMEKVALMGAFSLYLNFLNLFVCLLRFFGEQKRRD